MAKLIDTINAADSIRNNALSPEQKGAWIFELEGKIAEILQKDIPENTFPEDTELLMPAPYDNVYTLYLCALIDYYNEETDLYTNDMAMFNAAFNEARAFLRRQNRPKKAGGWKV